MILRYHAGAQKDLRQAIKWYQARSLQAPGQFLVELDLATGFVLNAPLSFPVFETHFRRVLLDRFPYSLIYQWDEASVTIIAIAHAKRRSTFWRTRRLT